MANTVTVDDRDPRITYTSQWLLGGVSDEFDSTTHGTATAGATATFKFTGSSVSVFGTIGNLDSSRTVSTYSIDGASPATYSAIAGTNTQYRQLFFHSPKLADGDHTLVITSTVPDTMLWLDYIQFTPAAQGAPNPSPSPVTGVTTVKPQNTPPLSNPDPSSTTTIIVTSPTPGKNTPDSNTTPTNTTPTNTSPTTGQNTSNTPDPNGYATATQASSSSSTNTLLDASQTPTNSAAASVASGSKVPAGAIAGAVVGACLILALIAIILILLRRQRRRAGDPAPSNVVTTPFTATGSDSASAMVETRFVPNHGDLSHSSGLSSYPSGFGYITHGGTFAEKTGLHRPQPSQSNSNATSFERETSEVSLVSPHGGISFLGARQSQQPIQSAQRVVNTSYAQSFGAGSLYQGDLDDTPPAYYQSPPVSLVLQQ